jgi:hypothetical protein
MIIFFSCICVGLLYTVAIVTLWGCPCTLGWGVMSPQQQPHWDLFLCPFNIAYSPPWQYGFPHLDVWKIIQVTICWSS